MKKKAKIIATLGPAIFSENKLKTLIKSGVDAFRINFSHNIKGIHSIVNKIRFLELKTKKRISLESIAGLIIGLLGGSVGLILGSIRLPAIIYILQIDPRKAAGSNLFIGFFIGILGWIGHAYLDQVNYNILFTMSFTGMIGSYIGASFTGKVSLSRFVLILGIILFIVGILLFIKPFMDNI